MKKTRIKEISTDGVSVFYPQYLGWFGRWKTYQQYRFNTFGEIVAYDCFYHTLKDAQEFLIKIHHKPEVKAIIHDNNNIGG